MKKAILIGLALAAAHAPTSAAAPAQSTYNVLLAGGSEANMIHVWLTPDGQNYVIDSIVALEVGGDVCTNPEGNPNELICPAPPIAGFEVNAGGGDDRVSVAKEVSIPVTMRGGSGHDTLIGGSGQDKLIGGSGGDRLLGGRGPDLLAGGVGNDVLLGGRGNDVLFTGTGNDLARGGPGKDLVAKFKKPRAKAP
jgi:Ca2+-binding RTX toxin-like protein